MATKAEIRAELRELYGNVLSQAQIMNYLKKGKSQTAEWVKDIPFTREGRKKRFLAIDVARKLYEQQQTAV